MALPKRVPALEQEENLEYLCLIIEQKDSRIPYE